MICNFVGTTKTMNETDIDYTAFHRIFRSTAKNDLDVCEGSITFPDLMLYINAKATPIKIDEFIPFGDETVAAVKNKLKQRKIVLEKTMPEHIQTLSKWINFINGRRDRRKLLMNDGVGFLSFMHRKVDEKTYNYIMELYSVEKTLTTIKFYELRKISYETMDFDNLEEIPVIRYPKRRK